MARYFKIMEIDEETYERITGETLDCAQAIAPIDGDVYVAVDETDEDEIAIGLEYFDSEAE